MSKHLNDAKLLTDLILDHFEVANFVGEAPSR